MKKINKFKTLFYTSFFLLIFSNCNIKNSERLYYYHKTMDVLKDSFLFSHFPDEDLIQKTIVGMPCYKGGGIEIIIFNKHEKLFIDKFIAEQIRNKLITYSIKDTCTNYYLIEDDSLLLKYGDCMRRNHPVPNYTLWYDPLETRFDFEDIKEDLTYYIVESKHGIYLPDSLLTKWYEPPYESMYNGFSRGYAVSRNANLLIYWLIVW